MCKRVVYSLYIARVFIYLPDVHSCHSESERALLPVVALNNLRDWIDAPAAPITSGRIFFYLFFIAFFFAQCNI